MKNILTKIHDLSLERKPEDYQYTLYDEKLDNVLGLNQPYAVFTPKSEAINEFASAAILYGTVGFEVSNFTSVPAGYVATFKKGTEVKTLFIMGFDEPYYMGDCLKQVKDLFEQKGINLFEKLKETSKNLSFLEIAHRVCSEVSSQNLEDIKQNIQQAIQPFSSNEDSLNSQNCKTNHKVLANICCEQLKINLPFNLVSNYITESQPDVPEIKEKEDILKVRELYNMILQNWILPGYFTYRGKDRQKEVPQNVEVLNLADRIEALHGLIKGEKNINAVINMCATDYTADVIYVILEQLNENNNKTFSDLVEKVNKIQPPTSDMSSTKHDLHKMIKKMTFNENN